jgi:hypothetical protein
LIVLRGGSSTGKSRSAYHAVSEGLLAKWRLEYPAVPAELARLLNEGIPSRTVLWLREFRDYADAEGGQEALARLARLLGGSNCIIALTTMWERSWYAYTGDHRGGPGTRDQYPAARALLAGLPELTARPALTRAVAVLSTCQMSSAIAISPAQSNSTTRP